jgi:hypothetical protein
MDISASRQLLIGYAGRQSRKLELSLVAENFAAQDFSGVSFGEFSGEER